MSYKKLKDNEEWCPYCDEYKVPKNEVYENVIDEILEDLKTIVSFHEEYRYFLNKWEDRKK